MPQLTTNSTGLLRVSLAGAAAGTVVCEPQLAVTAGKVAGLPAAAQVVWLVLLLAAAPVAAYLAARRTPAWTSPQRPALAGVPQLPLAVVLVRLDVWWEVRSGYLLAGSGEEAMAYGLGTMAAAVLGLLLSFLVAVAAVVGATAADAASRAG